LRDLGIRTQHSHRLDTDCVCALRDTFVLGPPRRSARSCSEALVIPGRIRLALSQPHPPLAWGLGLSGPSVRTQLREPLLLPAVDLRSRLRIHSYPNGGPGRRHRPREALLLGCALGLSVCGGIHGTGGPLQPPRSRRDDDAASRLSGDDLSSSLAELYGTTQAAPNRSMHSYFRTFLRRGVWEPVAARAAVEQAVAVGPSTACFN